MQNKINEIFKGDNMENSNQIEAPVKFGILEEEKVSRKFYPVKNAPADTVLPKRKTAKSAGYDFVLPCDVRLNPHSISAIIPTNVKAYMPDDEVLMLYIRSSIGIKHHVTLANGTGIIDADYFSNPDNDGNIGICLQNNSNEIVSFKKANGLCKVFLLNMLYATATIQTKSARAVLGQREKNDAHIRPVIASKYF